MIDGHIYADGIYEPRLIDYLSLHVRGRTMLDIGANIGNHALSLSKNFEDVHCFEPNPLVVERLEENIALNGIAVAVHPVGLGDEDVKLPFHSNITGNLGGGSFVHTQFPVSDILPIRHADDYLETHGIRNVDFIKLDVEGFEPRVLRGLCRTIVRDRPIIAFEYDGQRGDPAVFHEIKAALPGYRVDDLLSFEGKSGLGKVVSALKGGIALAPAPINQPQARFYEALLARPDDA